jgi:hypothetical protein
MTLARVRRQAAEWAALMIKGRLETAILLVTDRAAAIRLPMPPDSEAGHFVPSGANDSVSHDDSQPCGLS